MGKLKVTCVDTGGFNLITKGKVYEVESSSRDFYFITNNAGVIKRYGKGRFAPIENSEEKPEAKIVKEVVRTEAKAKERIVKCIIPSPTAGIVYGRLYRVVGESDDHSKYLVVRKDSLPTEEAVEALKSRFVDA